MEKQEESVMSAFEDYTSCQDEAQEEEEVEEEEDLHGRVKSELNLT